MPGSSSKVCVPGCPYNWFSPPTWATDAKITTFFVTLYSQQNHGILPVLSPLKSASGSNSTGSDTAGSRVEAES